MFLFLQVRILDFRISASPKFTNIFEVYSVHPNHKQKHKAELKLPKRKTP